LEFKLSPEQKTIAEELSIKQMAAKNSMITFSIMWTKAKVELWEYLGSICPDAKVAPAHYEREAGKIVVGEEIGQSECDCPDCRQKRVSHSKALN